MQPKRRLRRLVIPLFLNHRGCSHRCIFCNQKSAVGEYVESAEDIKGVICSYIESQLNKFGRINPKYSEVQIAFYGGSFTCMRMEEMERFFLWAKESADFDFTFRISTRPDCIDEDILLFLKRFNVKTIELGCESFDDRMLEILKRGHTAGDTVRASGIIKKHGFELVHQIMVGLPFEDEEVKRKNFHYLSRILPDFLRIFPLVVLKGTYLEKMYKDGVFSPLSIDEAVEILTEYYMFCEEKGIEIIQMGLHYSENLLNNVVKGAIHPSFRDLVMKNLRKKRWNQ